MVLAADASNVSQGVTWFSSSRPSALSMQPIGGACGWPAASPNAGTTESLKHSSADKNLRQGVMNCSAIQFDGLRRTGAPDERSEPLSLGILF